MSSKYDIDITNKKFGGWTALRRDSNHLSGTNSKWICKCVCGTVRSVGTRQLINHKTNSCGCLHSNLHRNLIGKHYGNWTVIDKADPIVNSHRRWKAWTCQCFCGTVRVVSEQSLISGKSTSCGCKRSVSIKKSEPYVDLTGKQFGYWTVLNHLPNTKSPSGEIVQNWLCKCVCGTVKPVSRTNLLSGRSISCGCMNHYSMEDYVSSLLSNLNICFEPQKSFTNLIGPGGKHLSYDFFINDSSLNTRFLIECQGEQHYHPVKFFGGIERFKRQEISDRLKKKFAIKHGYVLILISYLDFKTLSDKKALKKKISNILSKKRKSNLGSNCNDCGGMASSQIYEI